ncbi:MAG: Ig-like domain-containing protein [Hyphomicrobiaceae bacterium]
MPSFRHPHRDVVDLLERLGVVSPTSPLRLALEPRVVFDASGVVLAAEADAATRVDGPSTETAGQAADHAELIGALMASAAPEASSTSVVFIDAAVQDAGTLANAIPTGAEIVWIGNDSDGVAQIAHYLAGRTGIESIHILSHGSAGQLRLGNGVLTTESISGEHADELATIRASLTDGADILIYGCDFGQDADAIAALARATGADIAASTDATGHADLGGDWELEASSGAIEATGIFAPDYSGLLAPLTITPVGTGGVTATSLAQQLMGSDVTIVSATLFGQPYQAGVFSGATGYSPSWLAFDSGVVFSSGSATGLPTSNTSDAYSAGITSFSGGYAPFAAIGGNASYNASYIEIAFIPDNDRIAIQFVFGSDEYNEYVYGAFSDAIAIWVNGTNIAVTPTGAPISIDTINQAGTYTPTFGTPGPSAAPSLFVNNDLQNGGGAVPIEMDGFTRTLGATITVTPGVVNVIRLGVSDIGDGGLDSWLLVKADSVQANLIAQNDTVGTTLNTPVTFDVLANDIDFDGDAKTIVNIADQPIATGQTLTLASGATVTLNADQTLTVSPALNSTNQELFTYTVSDGNGNTATAYATINIVSGTPPTLDLDASAAGTGFSTIYAVGGGSVAIADVDATVSDADNIARATISLGGSFAGDLLSVGALPAGVSVDASSTATSIVLVGNVSPATMASAIKAVSFSNSSGAPDLSNRLISVQVTDATGLSSAIAQTTISLVVPNTPPVANDDTLTTAEDTPLSTNVITANGIDSDADSDPLSIVSATIDFNGDGTPDALALATPTDIIVGGNTIGTLTLTSAGDLSFAPAANYNGPVPTLTYTLSDGIETDIATITITVTPVNDAPVAADDAVTTPEDQPVAGTLPVATDVDGDPLTYAAGATAPAHGTVTVNPDGSYLYTPAPDYNGPDSFTYTVSDGTTAIEHTVTVTVTPVNDAPVGSAAPITTPEDTPAVGQIVSTDLDGDPLSITLATPPANGTLTLGPDGSFTYTPNPDFHGPDSFVVTIDDGQGGTSQVTVPITVTDVNDTPVATPSDSSGDEDTPIAVGLAGTDKDGGIVAITVTALPATSEGVLYMPDGMTPVVAGAPLTPAAAAGLVFVPAPDFHGSVSITFTVTDDDGAVSTPAGTTITVIDVIDPPTIPALDGREPSGLAQAAQNMLDAMASSDASSGVGPVTGPVLRESQRINQFWEIYQERGGVQGAGSSDAAPLLSSSLQFGIEAVGSAESGLPSVRTELFLRNGLVSILFSDIGSADDAQIVAYRVQMTDGRALPDWIEWKAYDMLEGMRAPDTDAIDIRVEALLTDGRTIVQDMRIDLKTGEILALKAKRADYRPLFEDQLRGFAQLDDRAVETLGTALEMATSELQ